MFGNDGSLINGNNLVEFRNVYTMNKCLIVVILYFLHHHPELWLRYHLYFHLTPIQYLHFFPFVLHQFNISLLHVHSLLLYYNPYPVYQLLYSLNPVHSFIFHLSSFIYSSNSSVCLYWVNFPFSLPFNPHTFKNKISF